jgi:hypothetical protein
MLRFLSIRHLAVIDRIELEFGPGLTVLTGETGAGKSILVGAVGLLVGGRASADLVRTGEESATIEAVFDAPDGREVIVRREVSAQGAQPRSSTARSSRAPRCGTSGNARRPARPARASGAARSSHPPRRARRLRRPGAERPASRRRSPTGTLKGERDRLLASQQESASRPSSSPSSSPRSIASSPKAGKTTSWPRPAGAGQRRQVQRLCRGLSGALRRRSAALAALGVVWRRVGELAAIDERSRRTWPRARRSSPPSRTWRNSPSYAADIDAEPGAPAGSRGPAGGLSV